MVSIKLAKYVPEDKIIHVKEAKNGLSCNCICVECGERFEAVQGKIRDWHFRHHENKECLGGQETALHKLAKRIIVESTEIHIPEQGKINYSEAAEEQPLGTFRPDVTVITNGETVYFEIVVTHRTDEAKWTFYEKRQYKSVEINIGHLLFEGIPPLEKIRQTIIEDLVCKQVIFWEKKEAVTNESKGEIKKEPTMSIWELLFAFAIFSGLRIWFRKKGFQERKFASNKRKYGSRRR